LDPTIYLRWALILKDCFEQRISPTKRLYW